ncbi:MAG: PLP-dependent transferase, partial [Actinomycetia bacterium]|nr:PLP-dependent transferase [Actinomycetes bacterium]
MTLHPDTIAVHAGAEHPDPATKAQATPLHQSVAFVFDDAQYAADLFDLKTAGHIYGRISNPTQDVFETRISALEGGVGTLATSSGMSAILLAILNLARAGDNFVALETLYGGSVTLFTHTLAELGIEARFVPPDRPDKLAALVDDHTRLLFAETIANPAITVPDLDAWGEAAHACDIPLVVDNTIATPILCRPLDHGADLVVHSTTKYIGGHGTSVGGAIVDGGRFDWAAHAERFPTMIEPDTSYHGVVWTDAFGPAAYITRARTVL